MRTIKERFVIQSGEEGVVRMKGILEPSKSEMEIHQNNDGFIIIYRFIVMKRRLIIL